LAKVAIFTPNVDAENQCLINHKTVCGALNRYFCHHEVAAKLIPCQRVVAFVHFFVVANFVSRLQAAVYIPNKE
jgi:hypothetical protein